MLSITKTTRRSLPSIPFEKIKNAVLSEDYDLSLVFTSKKLSQELNARYRGKDKPTNVLAFPLSKTSGEIFLDLETAKSEMSDFGMNLKKFVTYLFIHGLLHLKGMDHSAKMEQAEKKFLKKFFL